MATTQQYIDQLKIDKKNLVTMLNNMGVEASENETFTSLTPKVGTIVTEPILQDKNIEITENGTTTITADSGYDGLNNVEVTTNIAASGGKYAPRRICFRDFLGTELNYELANLDTSNVTDMSYMFMGCENLTELDLSNWDTSQVTTMKNMFQNCPSLTTFNISSFDTKNVTSMLQMFTYWQTPNITTLDLSHFDTTRVSNFSSTFQHATTIEELNLSSWVTSAATNTSYMFNGCTALKKIDIRNCDFSKVSSYTGMFNSVPTNCLIIVKNSTVKSWVKSKFSSLSNVKTVSEL